ncbi:SDR family oxidoreductase [Marinicella sp. S1101]|uniref:SDR family NAD(P)-dependent oxidoreductase n=1 Tax=Marinicella marina TaxID=2996016 RepID=UPI002260D88C|nr:SDR family oxidoreductase [Marinicella marina]MCX7553469.1 SDR family oxidoreductase [Marinicella marina]MDJ1140093.1 SDR family oxidoreductase [Marinicella marina]
MNNQKWALITGASAGIGAEFARQLAAKGWSLLLVARRTDKLTALQTEVTNHNQVECQILAVDLAEVNANQLVFNYCHEQKINISMLVNNAGYGVPGDFDAVDWTTHQAMLQVMLISLVELSHLFYPNMKKEKQGFIINVASLAGLTPPTAGHTLYGALKSFVIKFSHSLHLEAKEHGVHVSALCPGFTYTEFHDVNGTRSMVSQMSKKLWMTASDVVSQGIQAVEKNQAVYINGRRNRMIAGLCKYLPEGVVRFLMKGSVAKFRKR